MVSDEPDGVNVPYIILKADGTAATAALLPRVLRTVVSALFTAVDVNAEYDVFLYMMPGSVLLFNSYITSVVIGVILTLAPLLAMAVNTEYMSNGFAAVGL